MNSLWRDIQCALRGFRRSPAFALTAFATLTIGIGGAIAAFSIVDSVLLKTLPIGSANEVVAMGPARPGDDGVFLPFPLDVFEAIRERARTLTGVAGLTSGRAYLEGDGAPVEMVYLEVVGDYFGLLGVRPVVGRFLDQEERRLPDGTRPAVIGYGYWRTAWGGREDVVGETVRLEDQPLITIVGVAPPGLEGIVPSLPAARIWMPLDQSPESVAGPFQRGGLNVFGRLAPESTLRSAQAEVAAIARPSGQQPSLTTTRVDRLFDLTVGREARRRIVIFAAAVGMVFFIGLTNLVNLQAGRISRRQRELSIRAALGASRMDLVRQMTVEAALLTTFAAALAFALVYAALDIALASVPPILPRQDTIGVDWTAFVFAVAVALAASLVIGALPALRASRPDVNETLKEGTPGTTESPYQHGLRGVLTFAETSLAIVLLVGASLLIFDFGRLISVEYGFKPGNVSVVEITLPRRYEAADRTSLARRLREELVGIPGVEAVATADFVPGIEARMTSGSLLGQPPAGASEDVASPLGDLLVQQVGEDFGTAMGMQLVAGRWIDGEDIRNQAPVAMVSASMAHALWPDENPLGRRIPSRLGTATELEVVGVSGEIRVSYRAESLPILYLPEGGFLTDPGTGRLIFVLRSSGPALSGPVVENLVFGLEPDSRVTVDAMNAILGRQVGRERFQTVLMASFAGVAVLLAVLGIYSVVAFATTERTREIGIRMALGARGPDVVLLMMRKCVVPAILGIAAGLYGAFALSEVLRSYLVRIEPTDPWTYAVVFIAGVILVVLAAWLPARRASRVDPITALRHE
jgi:predicted permease